MAQSPAVRILNAAARHIERVGLYQGGEHLWQPGRMGDTAPCGTLHAWDRGVCAARPARSVTDETQWEAFRHGHARALKAISDLVNGTPINPVRWRMLRMSATSCRQSVLWEWGDQPGRTAEECAAAFREAARLVQCDDDYISLLAHQLQNMV
ncbi:DUF6197 family protein [Streptacidiphilus sp. MAP5-3]|uniref:DUF6197 family protein n=1 Tax=unclassified Streptacidiphilus TaxID=2643834 RepID=UPI003512B934